MINIIEHLKTTLVKYNVQNYEHAISALTASQNPLEIELALKECEAYSLNLSNKFNKEFAKYSGLLSPEGFKVGINEKSVVRIEFLYGEDLPEMDICELPLFVYKGLLYDYYNSIRHALFHNNGQARLIGQTFNFLRFGIWTEYYENGQMKSKGEYLNSNKIGEWKYFYQNGQIESIQIYNQIGKREGSWTQYYENGQIKSEGEYSNYFQIGKWKYFYENGQMKSIEMYTENGEKDGEWIEWHLNNNIKSKICFKNNQYDDNPKSWPNGAHIYNSNEIWLDNVGSVETQPGLIIHYASINSNNKKFILPKFELGINSIKNYSLGYKKWLFVAKSQNYYLLDLDSGEIFNLLVWFRENGRNHSDYLIKNYFKDDKLYVTNTRSEIIFNLITKEKDIKKT